IGDGGLENAGYLFKRALHLATGGAPRGADSRPGCTVNRGVATTVDAPPSDRHVFRRKLLLTGHRVFVLDLIQSWTHLGPPCAPPPSRRLHRRRASPGLRVCKTCKARICDIDSNE